MKDKMVFYIPILEFILFSLHYILGCEITVANCKSLLLDKRKLETWLSIFLGVNVVIIVVNLA